MTAIIKYETKVTCNTHNITVMNIVQNMFENVSGP